MTCRAVIHLLGHEAGLLRQQLALSGHVAQGGAPPPVLLQRVQLHPVEQRLEDGELWSVLIQSKQCSDSDSVITTYVKHPTAEKLSMNLFRPLRRENLNFPDSLFL